MDENNNNQSGSQPADNTSALFVTARKKQLEQQEAERVAKEKEDQRLAAEAEVRRLEAEVEERRRRAEEEARRVEAEAAEKKRQIEEESRRVAEEARIRNAQTAAGVYQPQGSPYQPQGSAYQAPGNAYQPQGSAYQAPSDNYQAPADSYQTSPESNQAPAAPPPADTYQSFGASSGSGAYTPPAGSAGSSPAKAGGSGPKPPLNKKLLIIIGGAAVAVIALVVILIVALGGNKNDSGYYGDIGGGGGTVTTPAPVQYSISGEYYLHGDESRDVMHFFDDGTMYIEYIGRETSDLFYFSIDEDKLFIFGELYNSDSPYIMTIINNDTLVDKDDDQFVRTRVSAAPPPSSSWDLYGYYYPNGDPSRGSLYFYSDGTFSLETDYGLEIEGTFTIEGNTVIAEYNGEYDYLTIINEDMIISGDGDIYAREGYSPPPSGDNDNMPWPVDANAALDAVEDIHAANMGVRFPSGIFYASNSQYDYLELSTYDPNGAVLMVRILDDAGSGLLYSDDVAPIINSIGANILSSIFGNRNNYWVEFEERMDPNAPQGTPIRYTAKVHFEENGTPYVGVVRISVWSVIERGQRTGEQLYYSRIMAFNEYATDEYGTLFLRIDDAIFDN